MELDDRSPLNNPLATKPIAGLITKFAIPAIISFLVNALYNIVDQIFIGQGVGLLGNAATNVAFPFTTIATSIALLLGIGSASNFNLNLGAGRREKAAHIAGTGITALAVCGIALGVVALIFLEPLLRLFGSTDEILPYAVSYTGIVAFGFPLVIFSSGCSQLIRADGSPTFSMLSVLSGAILNTILDPIFIFGFKMGMAGAALATVLGQLVSALFVLWYLVFRFKTFRVTREYLRPRAEHLRAIVSLGAAACFNQLAMTVVQIAMNNTLQHYGSLSQYGSDIPLACVGVISKVNIVYMAFILGISQGCQPLFGFNYGAKIYQRVKKTYLTAAVAVTAVSCAAFLCFQIFPRPIVSIFGQGSELYFQFAERYFRIYMFMVFANGLQPLTANFFTSIGKAHKGILMSLTRQVIFLLPLILIFPIFMGIDGVMYAGPIADFAAAILAISFTVHELHVLDRLTAENGPQTA
ncbi:MAG: MATE family efflux transporter [Clostridia bacterium]|nr:MATE family efflux transporter [Clostridia bacterium]